MATVEFVHVTKKFENGFVAVGVGGSYRRRSSHRRSRRQLQATAGQRYRHGLPELRAVSTHDCAENIEFGLKLHHMSDEEMHRRIALASELLGLDDLLEW